MASLLSGCIPVLYLEKQKVIRRTHVTDQTPTKLASLYVYCREYSNSMGKPWNLACIDYSDTAHHQLDWYSASLLG